LDKDLQFDFIYLNANSAITHEALPHKFTFIYLKAI
jgi:hypothetical protein